MERHIVKRLSSDTTWRIAGVISLAIFLGLSFAFCYQLARINLLPMTYLVSVCVGIAVIAAALIAMQFYKKTRLASDIVSAILCVLLFAGIQMLSDASHLLNEVSDVKVVVNTVNVYVEEDDPAQSITDAQEYVFGILKLIDRTNTDQCIQALEAELGAGIKIVEYDSVAEVANALLDQKIGAIIMNDAHFSLLDDNEELSDFEDQIRILWSFDIQRDLKISSVNDGPDNTNNLDSEGPFSITTDPFVVYISGNDSYGKLRSAGRSDVNILMAINPETDEILLVNTPRDYFVEISVADGAMDKLTHAGIYGVDVSMNTLSTLYNVPIRYYVHLNFSGFMDIIDALGGITVESDIAFSVADWNYVVGENELSGIEALAFARERYSFGSGDRQRGKNQQAVIEGVIRKVASPSILLNYKELMSAVSGTVETSMTQDDISSLVQMQLEEGKTWSITSISVDGSDDSGPCYSIPDGNVYRMIPNMDTVEAASTQLQEILQS